MKEEEEPLQEPKVQLVPHRTNKMPAGARQPKQRFLGPAVFSKPCSKGSGAPTPDTKQLKDVLNAGPKEAPEEFEAPKGMGWWLDGAKAQLPSYYEADW